MPEPSSDILQVGVASERLGGCPSQARTSSSLASQASASELELFGFGRRRGSFSLGVAGARLVRRLGICLDAFVDKLGGEVTQIRRRGLGGLAARCLDNFRFCSSRLLGRLHVSGNVLGRFWFSLAESHLRLGENLFGKIEVGRALDRLAAAGARPHAAPPPPPLRGGPPTALAAGPPALPLSPLAPPAAPPPGPVRVLRRA